MCLPKLLSSSLLKSDLRQYYILMHITSHKLRNTTLPSTSMTKHDLISIASHASICLCIKLINTLAVSDMLQKTNALC